MPTITFIEHSGEEHTVSTEAGLTVMQAAVGNHVPGIVADCGGCCSCATCHVYLDPKWQSRVNPPSSEEQAMLECVLSPQENSRLSCQIKVTDELDGLVVRLPESQL